MVKKISGRRQGDDAERKSLQSKRLRLKSLHKSVAEDRAALDELPPDRLPPASSSNAARQARSRLNNTFPIDWQKLHLSKHEEKKSSEETDPDSRD